MPLRYISGEEIMKGDRVLYGGEWGIIELVADPAVSDPETHWFIQEYGRGVMISELERFGRIFTSDPEDDGDLELLSRSEQGL
ncbi:MAG TPA: hypothetical protein VFW25_08175 [Silvibacterium sp.]|nr:hypothetical protein [Silvibacterium sp.]